MAENASMSVLEEARLAQPFSARPTTRTTSSSSSTIDSTMGSSQEPGT